jgi:probable non-F420 flavinoid oxidoreductase
MLVGYHASHEQFPPDVLLGHTVLAEQAGFRAAMASDHFAPFSRRQGESGFVWSWLGAALTATSLSFGTVSAPGQRYHPAILAQAAATVARMFPGRFWLALGSGQLVNEVITGEDWPSEQDRDDRLLECIQVIRKLLSGEQVDRSGRVTVRKARLYTLPEASPLLFGAALTPETARLAGSWADGLITVSQPADQLRDVVAAFRANGGAGKPLYLQAQVSYAGTYEKALIGAHDQWRMSVLPSDVMNELATPDEIDAKTGEVSPDQVAERVFVSAKPEEHVEWLKQFETLGFDRVYVHNVNREQEEFIRTYRQHVLPCFDGPEDASPD